MGDDSCPIFPSPGSRLVATAVVNDDDAISNLQGIFHYQRNGLLLVVRRNGDQRPHVGFEFGRDRPLQVPIIRLHTALEVHALGGVLDEDESRIPQRPSGRGEALARAKLCRSGVRLDI